MTISVLNIESYGLELTLDKSRVFPYELEIADPATPTYTTEGFDDIHDALDRVVELVIDINQVYAPEDLEYKHRAAYDDVQTCPVTKRAVVAFLRSTFEGIAFANERKAGY